jgi:hypothetical protein
MKNRHGFVSNSSSSSFIVKYADKEYGKITFRHIDKHAKNKLKEYGFVQTDAYGPEQYSYADKFDPTKDYLPFVNYGYDVTVNQDDVIYFLLKNNIPFHASCHYGDEDVYYVKDSECFYTIQNVGRQAESILKYMPPYGEKKCFDEINDYFKKNEDWFQKTNVKEWLAKNKAWQEDEDK